jgi:hypothetical protein
MSSLKCLVSLFAFGVLFINVGCENGRGDDDDTVVTNIVYKTKDRGGSTTLTDGDSLPVNARSIVVNNNTAGTTIAVTISTTTCNINPNDLNVWTISGPTTMHYDAGTAGSGSVEIGDDSYVYHYTFTDSASKPGSVKLVGGPQD